MEHGQTVLYQNGKIFTANPDCPDAEAMLVTDGKIIAIGSWREVSARLQQKDAAVVDLGGRRVLPGLIDAHMHALLLADTVNQIPCVPPEISSIAELQDAIRAKRALQGENVWIEGWGYDEGKLLEGRAPNRYDLDSATEDAPVMVLRTCYHICAVNSFALRLAGIDRNTPDPEGGQIDRDKNGEPTGILRENAKNLLDRVCPQKRTDDMVNDLLKLGQRLLSNGITTISDAYGNWSPYDCYDIFQKAQEKGLSQRVMIYYAWDQLKAAPPSFSSFKKDRTNPVYIAGVKIIGDGSVSGRTAWCDRPYLGGDGDCGMPVATEDDILSAYAYAKKNGLQLMVHAMGSQAIDRAVKLLSPKAPWLEGLPSIRIEHVAMPSAPALDWASKAGMAFVTQPIFMYAEIESYQNNLGPERTIQVYPYLSMLNQGIPLAFSSDAPSTAWADPSDPWSSIQSAVTRRAYDGTDTGSDQRIGVADAISRYTSAAQQITGIPGIGRLSEGYEADFIVLDRDILEIPTTEIGQVKVIETYVHGDLVYRRER